MGRVAKFIPIALLTFALCAGAQTASSPRSREPGRAPSTVNPVSKGALTRTPVPSAPKSAANSGPKKRELNIAGFKFQRPDPATMNQDDSNLPPASSPLPLISVIGFGVLVGGIISAMKTRSQ